MKALEKYSKEDLTISEIVQQVKKTKLVKYSEERIAKQKENIRVQKAKNKKSKEKIKALESKINSKRKYSHFQKLGFHNDIDIEKENIKTVAHMEERLKMFQGKDFSFIVNDGFNNPYKVKRSQIVKMKTNKFFIDKIEDGINRTIERLAKSSDPKRHEKIDILQNRLLKVVQFNREIDSIGNKEISKLSTKEKSMIRNAYSGASSKIDKNKYPLNVIISGELISII